MIAWFYSQVLTEPSTTCPCSWHWQILTQSQSNTSECRVAAVFTVLQPLSPVSFMRWPCLLPGDQGHPGSHPGCLLHCQTPGVRVATASQSAHVKLVLKTRHQGSLSECCYGRHTLEENSNGFIRPGPVDLALDSSLFSSWAELCFALMGMLSYVRRDYLIRIPPHEPVLILCSFTHLEVRPLMTWVQTCNWTFCSVKAQAQDTDHFKYECFVVL